MGLKEIKLRMQAINKTASITQAMYNIALSKLKKSNLLLENAQYFKQEVFRMLKQINHSIETHRLIEQNEVEKKLYVLVTSDRGLCGSYHNQLFKAFLEEVKTLSTDDYQVLALGKKGFYFGQKRKLPMVNMEIIYNRDDVLATSFREYASLIKDVFVNGFIDEVILFNNHYVNTGTQVVEKKVILPVLFDEKKQVEDTYIFDVDPVALLDDVIDVYIEGSIFEALADAKLSEHASRMIAMKNATDNAHEIVERLNTMYHRARQQEITSELIDVVNGSNV